MRSRKYSYLKRNFCFFLIIVGLILILSIFIFSNFLRPVILSVSQKIAENAVSKIIDEEVKKLMLEEFLSYDKITAITRDSNGNVTSISANSVLINNFANELDICIGNRIDKAETMENKVFLSSLIGADFLAGIGPKVPVRFQPISVTTADISHTFQQAGINQTLHTIVLTVSVDVEILMPLAYSKTTIVSKMPIAQTLIVGTVPHSYFKKN